MGWGRGRMSDGVEEMSGRVGEEMSGRVVEEMSGRVGEWRRVVYHCRVVTLVA